MPNCADLKNLFQCLSSIQAYNIQLQRKIRYFRWQLHWCKKRWWKSVASSTTMRYKNFKFVFTFFFEVNLSLVCMQEKERGVNVCTLLVPPSHTFEPDAILRVCGILKATPFPRFSNLACAPTSYLKVKRRGSSGAAARLAAAHSKTPTARSARHSTAQTSFVHQSSKWIDVLKTYQNGTDFGSWTTPWRGSHVSYSPIQKSNEAFAGKKTPGAYQSKPGRTQRFDGLCPTKRRRIHHQVGKSRRFGIDCETLAKIEATKAIANPTRSGYGQVPSWILGLRQWSVKILYCCSWSFYGFWKFTGQPFGTPSGCNSRQYYPCPTNFFHFPLVWWRLQFGSWFQFSLVCGHCVTQTSSFVQHKCLETILKLKLFSTGCDLSSYYSAFLSIHYYIPRYTTYQFVFQFFVYCIDAVIPLSIFLGLLIQGH